MIMNYFKDKKLRNLIIKVPREHSSMLYFILESNDNLSFYSTLSFEKDALYREITLYCTPEFSEQLDNLLEHFHQRYPIKVLEDKIVTDSL